jgi:DNA polymerase-3 subunit chi
MTVKFYHLTKTPLEKALPQIMRKVVESGQRAIIRFADEDILKKLDDAMWTSSQKKPVPHGKKQDGFEEHQPVYLTLEEENPNNSKMIVNIGVESVDEFATGFESIIDIFDGNDNTELERARKRFLKYKELGREYTYHKQNEKGGWEQG